MNCMINMKSLIKNNSGDIATMAISLTIFLVIVGYVLAPIGLTAMENVNVTSAGVDSGTNASIWDALVPISLAGLIIGVIYAFKNSSG
jgi:hypothetical protein